jgi:hypothetical protein
MGGFQFRAGSMLFADIALKKKGSKKGVKSADGFLRSVMKLRYLAVSKPASFTSPLRSIFFQ